MIENELLQKDKEQEPSNYSNYYTWYRYYQNLDKELDYKQLFKEFRNGIGKWVCFSSLFRTLENFKKDIGYHKCQMLQIDELDTSGSETILIGMWLRDFGKRSSENNYCLVSPKYIDEWCRAFQDVFKYDVAVILSDEENPDACFVRLDIPEITKYGNMERVLLTWVRYLYEAPYNYCPVDALRLKRLDKFKDYSLVSLFNLVSHSSKKFGPFTYWGTGHSICKGGGIIKSEYIKQYLEQNKSTKKMVNEFCSSHRYSGTEANDVVSWADMWDALSQDKFEIRVKSYEKVLDVFNKNIKD